MSSPRPAPALRRHSVLGLVLAGALMPFALLGIMISLIATMGSLMSSGTDDDLSGAFAVWWSLLVVLLTAFGALFARYGWASARAADWTPGSVTGLILLWMHVAVLVVAALSAALALLLPGAS